MVNCSSADGGLEGAQRILAHVLPDYRPCSLETIEGGATNSNVLVRFEGCDDAFVLRRHLRGTEACLKEVHLLQALQNMIPVPEVVKSDETGNEVGTPYLIYRYVPGLTFRQIRANGTPRDMADAAHAIGRTLATLRNCDISLPSTCPLVGRLQLTEHQLAHPLLEKRVGATDVVLLKKLFAKWSQVSNGFANERSLVHGDFNHRNILLTHQRDQWEVAAILDWELAGVGSSLWDAARFTCYEKPDSVHWEPYFVDGFRSQSVLFFPDDWGALSRVMNTLSAAESLAGTSVQERFVPELTRLVHAGLRGERIG